MRIILNGQQAFGQAVLEALLERGDDVVAVYCAPDKEGRPADTLKVLAQDKGLPVYQPASFKKPEVWEEMRALKPDLGVMAYVTLFVPAEVRDMPTHGTIQYHPSLLPLHRGPSSINWPIIMGAKKTGLSIFYPDDGLDEGPILMQKTVEIGENDTLGSIYFDSLFPMGVAAMLESIDLVKAGTAPRIEQDESKATYESWCKKADAKIDWSKPVAQVHNLIRGTNPQPGAWTTRDGETLDIYDCVKLTEPGGAPGEVIRVDGEGFAVSAGDGQILVKRVRPAGGKKVDAADYIAASGLVVGTRLG